MAELIDKGEVTKEMWWLFNNYVNNASNFEPEETEAVNRSFGRLQNIIDGMPTTTEPEIRAMAYDKAYLKLHRFLVDNMFKFGLTPIEIDWICEGMAEQLKEE